MIAGPSTQPPGSAEGMPEPRANLSAMLLVSSAVAALGGLLFGFDTAVISGTESALREVFGLDARWLGLTVSSALFGTIFGSLGIGKAADALGRKPVLVAMAVFYVVASLGSGLAWDWWSLVAFRFLGGIAVGGASVVSPLYIAEIAPARYRGRLVVLQQFNIVLGMLVAYLSNYAIARMGLGLDEWRWMLGIQVVPSALFFALLFVTPESPRWLMLRGRVDQARAVLARLGVVPGAQGIDLEVAEIERSIREDQARGRDSLFRWRYRKPIALAVMISVFNQLSGINAVLYYAPGIFKMTGVGANSALMQSVILGAVNMVFTMLAMTVIDRFGRKFLMVIGSLGYILSLSLTAWVLILYEGHFDVVGGYILLSSLLVFIASHAFGQGAVIWVFIGEVFPNSVRGEGQALGCGTHWVMAAIVTGTFPEIQKAVGGYVFAFYAAMMVVQLGWVFVFMPETKGVPLEEVRRKLGIE